MPYAEAIGSILWPAMVSRPDVAYAVGILAQFIQNPAIVHWNALKRVIVYLRTTKELWLTMGGTESELVTGYCDADWGSQSHRHSISGYAFYMGEGTVSWSSKKQHIIALSTTEAEYIALTHAAKEALWLRTFLMELRNKPMGPIMIRSDNQGAIALSKDNKFHARTKHIDLQYHFIRECVADSKIRTDYVPTKENASDIFMKLLPKVKFTQFAGELGLRMV